MFTGIVTEIGKVRSTVRAGASMSVEIECHYPSLQSGESIAVDGVCLTVAQVLDHGFIATMSAETLARTTLGRLQTGTRVNLERALAIGDRLGGHIVMGHVDAVGHVVCRQPVGDSERWTVHAPPEVHRLLAVKGSVAMDGVSLTINALGATTFEVMLVPFTLAKTTLSEKPAGSPVNLEADVLARYVARILEGNRSETDPGCLRSE